MRALNQKWGIEDLGCGMLGTVGMLIVFISQQLLQCFQKENTMKEIKEFEKACSILPVCMIFSGVLWVCLRNHTGIQKCNSQNCSSIEIQNGAEKI